MTSQPPGTAWFLRSYGDKDTHCGRMRDDGTVLSRCGVVFKPRLISRGVYALDGNPTDPDQICPQCLHGRPADRRAAK